MKSPVEFDIFYRKNKNDELFRILEKPDMLNIEKPQNYIPLYNLFFSLNEQNWNNINLNHKWAIKTLTKKMNDNLFESQIFDTSNNINKAKIFFKFGPLLDPLKYLVGKYDGIDIFELPKIGNVDTCMDKVMDPNNSSYVDGFFTYLTSNLLHQHNFIHGLDYYGGFVALKNNFKFDVADELDYIDKSNYFHKNEGVLFNIDNDYQNELMNVDSRNYKKRLHISEKTHESIDSISNISFKGLFTTNEEQTARDSPIEDSSINIIFKDDNIASKHSKSSSSSGSTCSSREISDNDEDSENSSDEYSDEEYSDTSTATDDIINASIAKFPVNIICLEACENTLDKLMINDELTNAEWSSAFMQIIMSLITYQKVFNMTHNDLHTNNVMYIPTEKQYIIYCYNNKHYKVPTHGKIYKIIDFGRAIYKFKGKTICSDSFSKDGDASTQYNFEPYFNEDKPRLEPNYSFDLCRLACSMFDYFIEDLDNIEKEKHDPISKLIIEWCKDDKGRNILYKNNGSERYPDFKLYKMIARNVHNHTPLAQLNRDIFDRYAISKNKINKKTRIINIDKMPIYT